MGTAIETEKIYYLSALGSAATIIGQKAISPKMPPEPLTQEQYDAQEERIKFYGDHGVISVARPGTREAAVKADEIKREEKRLADVYAGDDGEEPDPTLRDRGFSIPEKYAEEQRGKRGRRPSQTTFSAPGKDNEPEPSLKCVTIKRDGERCGNDAKPDLMVCGTHLRMLKKGAILKDELGRRISSDGEELKAE